MQYKYIYFCTKAFFNSFYNAIVKEINDFCKTYSTRQGKEFTSLKTKRTLFSYRKYFQNNILILLN